jgi:hypothetical protein
MGRRLAHWAEKLWAWSKNLWAKVKPLVSALVAVGVFTILWQEWKEVRQETEQYNVKLRSAYAETALNRASAEDARDHFASGIGTVSGVVADAAQSLALDEQTPDFLTLSLNLYARQIRSASNAMEFTTEIYRETCSLPQPARDEAITRLENLIANQINPLLEALDAELNARNLGRPLAEGVREGSIRRYCVPPA